MKLLHNLGFMHVGTWSLYRNNKSGISFTLNSLRDQRVVYAFVVDDDIKYIGVCDNTSTTLADRMSRYKNMQGTGTNKRIAERIQDCLIHGRSVRIFALLPQTPVQYCGVPVDLVKGLENPLIRLLTPQWNIQT
jgi:hypothetical protein